MTEQVYRLTPRVRRQAKRAPFLFALVWGLPWSLLGLASDDASGRLGALLIFAIPFVPISVYIIAQLAGKTEVTPDGLRLRGLFVRRFVRWEQIRTVDSYRGPKGYFVVKVLLMNGRKRRVPGFYTESSEDAEYDAQVADFQYVVREAIGNLSYGGMA
ncbi:PH domain-containing protein [Spirillospora sp. NPDC052269]